MNRELARIQLGVLCVEVPLGNPIHQQDQPVIILSPVIASAAGEMLQVMHWLSEDENNLRIEKETKRTQRDEAGSHESLGGTSSQNQRKARTYSQGSGGIGHLAVEWGFVVLVDV